jgi:hypothetical protein
MPPNMIKCVRNLFVTNMNYPVCVECVHHVVNDIVRCSQFGEKNIVNGNIKYEEASVCRFYNNMCGKQGIHFSPIDHSKNKCESNNK